MRWTTQRNKVAPVLNEVALSVDYLAKKHFPVHVKALASFRIDDIAAAAKRARRTSGTQGEMSALVHDIFVRHLRSVMETFAWDEMIRNRLRLIEQICAASAPEMSGLGLRSTR
jgi:uncharacterized membrane protein YqiK